MKDLTGMKFDKLLVIKKVKIKNRSLWECVCDCKSDKYVYVSTSDLNSGNTKSCGCYQKEMASSANKRYNKYDLSGDYGIGYTRNKGCISFYFDLEDYDLIKEYCWHIGSNERLVARNSMGGTPIKFHRLILGFPDEKMDIDHMNRNKMDNRKSNLRICLHEENHRNIKVPKNNTTGFIGIYFRKDSNKYYAKIEHKTNVLRLGTFQNIDDAILARLKKEKELWGDFAPQRHLFEKYNI